MRFQTTDRSLLDVKIDQAEVGSTWTWVTWTGHIECRVAADDEWPNLMDFARVTGGTMEVRYWTFHWGDSPVAT